MANVVRHTAVWPGRSLGSQTRVPFRRAVSDGDPQLPTESAAATEAGGWACTSCRWSGTSGGVTQRPEGKAVWAEFDRQSCAAAAMDAAAAGRATLPAWPRMR